MEGNKINVNLNKNTNINEREVKDFFSKLFSFDKSLLLDFIFYIHIFVQSFVFVSYMFFMARAGILHFIVGIIFYPIIFFLVRFIFEIITIIFSINKNLSDIKDKLDRK